MNPLFFHRTFAAATGGVVGWFLATLTANILGLLSESGMIPASAMTFAELVPLGICLCVSTGLFVSVTARYQLAARQAPVEILLIIAVGTFLGAIIGAMAGGLFMLIPYPWLGRGLAVILVGGVVGSVAGLNVDDLRIPQLALTTLGGIIGGVLGAIILFLTPAALGTVTQYFEAFAWTTAMLSVGLFASVLPGVVSGARFRFEHSDHHKSSGKYVRRSWDLPPGQAISVGSNAKLFAPNICLIDRESIAPMHALVSHSQAGGYTIELHPEAGSRASIYVDGKAVRGRVRLRDGNKVKFGSTTLLFETKRGEA